jgi:hypothetical protein
LTIVGASIIFIPIESVGNLVFLIGYAEGWIPIPQEYNGPMPSNIDIAGASLQIGMLIIFLAIMFFPAIHRSIGDRIKGINKFSHSIY